MGTESENRAAFAIQQGYCTTMGAPITARVAAALGRCLTRASRTGARVIEWPGEPTADALPLRLVGGLHALAQAGAAPALAAVFAGLVTAPSAVEAALVDALVEHDAALLPWLEGPPQTNEPGRSGVLMTGLLEVVRRHGAPVEVLEIGSSAGLNLMIDRYRFDLGGVSIGPADSPVTIRPAWRGPPPPAEAPLFTDVRGVDIAPIDLADPAARRRLRAYVWADNPDRLARLDAAFAMMEVAPVRLAAGDAAEWIEARLAEPQAGGVTRVVMHSVVWQYLGHARQARIAAAMAAAGGRATPERPLAWIAMEPDRSKAQMAVTVRSWPGGATPATIAVTQAHGAWVDTETIG